MAYSWRALLALHRGWDREALEFGERALELARGLGDRATEAHALCNIGGALLGRGDRTGYAAVERSLALALEDRLEDHAARAYRTVLFYAVLIHDFARAQQTFQDGVEYCEERGIFSHSAYIRAYYTTCELDRGCWTEAARMATELLQGSEVTGVQQRITILATQALVRLRRGDPGADAFLTGRSASAPSEAQPHRPRRARGALSVPGTCGDTSTSAREAVRGLAHVRGYTSPWIKGELLFWVSRVQPVDSADDVAEPYRLMLQGQWRAAAQAWQHLGMPYEQALSLAQGPEDALREALGILDGLGAAPLAAMVRLRLRQPARRIPRGPRAATRRNPRVSRREVQVLTLLVAGHTNSQLAHRLHLSAKTVEHHVSAILEKLDVHSRTEAVAAAFGLGIVKAGS
jgi:DNA-binding CsgD family transcriptional regulator